MNIFFRVDSSIQIGTGHLMRCLTLAYALREKKAKVSFICRELSGNLCIFIEKKGFKVDRLPCSVTQFDGSQQNLYHAQWLGVKWEIDAEQTRNILIKEDQGIDWLIVDHYAIDKQWETLIRPHVEKIMVIDDLADRPHDCDLLLDQNLYDNMETRYEVLVPNHCQVLLGPRYALLRQEFIEARKNLRERDGNVKNILIFFGGVDPTNETLKAIEAIQLLNSPDIAVDVVVGAANPSKDRIKEICLTMSNAHYHCQVDNMALLMVNADLAIGAGGGASWERCALGLPAIVKIVAENQRESLEALADAGAIIKVSDSGGESQNILRALQSVMETPSQLIVLSRGAGRIMEGWTGNEIVNMLMAD